MPSSEVWFRVPLYTNICDILFDCQTKGDRNAATGDKGSMAEFNVETQEGKDAMKELIKV